MPHDVCIFCERAKPLVKITKEHLFSRWVDDVLTPDLLGPDRSFERTTAGRDGFTATKTWSTEVIAAIEAAVVCGGRRDGCNGGWMSELDGQVRQLLEPMMLGKPRKPTPEDQLTIAAWAAMKSMVLEYSWGPDQVIVVPQAARTFVFRQRRAPGSMQIRVAAVESQGRPALFARRVYQLQPKASTSPALPGFASCSNLGARLFRRPDLRNLDDRPSRVAAIARPRPPGHEPAERGGHQLAAAGCARRSRHGPVRAPAAAGNRRLIGHCCRGRPTVGQC